MRPNPMVTLAKANGLTRDVYFNRLRHGWSPEEAATTPTGGPSRRWAPKGSSTTVRDINRLIARIPVTA